MRKPEAGKSQVSCRPSGQQRVAARGSRATTEPPTLQRQGCAATFVSSKVREGAGRPRGSRKLCARRTPQIAPQTEASGAPGGHAPTGSMGDEQKGEGGRVAVCGASGDGGTWPTTTFTESITHELWLTGRDRWKTACASKGSARAMTASTQSCKEMEG